MQFFPVSVLRQEGNLVNLLFTCLSKILTSPYRSTSHRMKRGKQHSEIYNKGDVLSIRRWQILQNYYIPWEVFANRINTSK